MHHANANASRMRKLYIALATSVSAGWAVVACSVPNDTIGIITSDAGSIGEMGATCSAGPLLMQRPEGTPVSLVNGMYDGDAPNSWPLIFQNRYVTLRGQGYLSITWQIEYAIRAGLITPPIITLTSGTFLHVGGGGGRNLDEPQPGATGTWMGNTEQGLSYMPAGAPTPWLAEFYYLDGQVTITQNESDGLYNVTVAPETYHHVVSPGWGVYNPGVVCDPR